MLRECAILSRSNVKVYIILGGAGPVSSEELVRWYCSDTMEHSKLGLNPPIVNGIEPP